MPPTQGPTILLVDDEQLVREVAQRSLQLKGYPVITAASGAEGLERFQAFDREIAIVIADIKMPGLTGPEMVEEIRRTAPKVNVLFISGDHEELPDWARETCGVLHKPFTPAKLVSAVEECLGLAAAKPSTQ
jgi:two-component system, cell cycle sensor histidine kinase and response regulator CckA